MSWSTLIGFPYEYSDEIRQIDEKLLELIQARKIAAGSELIFPPEDQIQAWANRFEMQPERIRWLFQTFQSSSRRMIFPSTEGNLTGIVPVLKKTAQEDCEYFFTHVMNHENVSYAHIEVSYLPETDDQSITVFPRLSMEIRGSEDYETRSYGHQGAGASASLRFLISPPLPDKLDGISFHLVPDYSYEMPKSREIVLDKPVFFS
ncbi:chorismate mutase family protein [Gorillibacterium timonense]|uniref:hypothetical protein n=1 Tax=Gorillibacterium timonense TaxID=1689269 RepID=UPI00071C7172|nr:hypothetical protein [Gorillibacterium timonense]